MTSTFKFAISRLAIGIMATSLSLSQSAMAAGNTPTSASANAMPYENILEGVEFTPDMTPEEIQNIVSQKVPPLSERDEWGCTCLLCLANPNGWKSVPECIPPIKRLFRELRKGKPMPGCPQADESKNNVKFVWNPVNPCSKFGLQDATGYISEQRGREVLSKKWSGTNEDYRLWDGPGTSYCVGKYLFTYRRCIEREGGRCVKRVSVDAYDKVVPNPMLDPIAIDVTIECNYWHREREF